MHNNARDIKASPIKDIQRKPIKTSQAGKIPFSEWEIGNLAGPDAVFKLKLKE